MNPVAPIDPAVVDAAAVFVAGGALVPPNENPLVPMNPLAVVVDVDADAEAELVGADALGCVVVAEADSDFSSFGSGLVPPQAMHFVSFNSFRTEQCKHFHLDVTSMNPAAQQDVSYSFASVLASPTAVADAAALLPASVDGLVV